MNWEKISGILAVVVLTACLSHWVWPGNGRIIRSVVTDTVFIPHYIHDSIPGKLKYVRIKDPVNIDSLWEEAKRNAYDEISRLYPDDSVQNGSFFYYRFQSAMDTTYSDSLLQLKVRFNSPIPLHPSSYFSYDVRYNDMMIRTVQVVNNRTFFDRFHWSVNSGIGYGLINRKFDIYIGLGGSFNL